MAQEQQQWEEAESYYQQALQIYSEYQDHCAQAGTYVQLGTLAKTLQQWEKASGYLLEALECSIECFAEYGETDSTPMIFLAQMWKEHDQKDLAAQVASRLKLTVDMVEQVFARLLGDDGESKTP
jgi:tetratricopeptide (TPR) repeat protein